MAGIFDSINEAVGNDPNDGTNALMRFGQALQGHNPMQSRQYTPAALLEWKAYQEMSPEQKREYLLMKRAQNPLNQGDQFGAYNPVTGTVTPIAPINPKVSEQPDYQAAQEKAKKDAQIKADAEASAAVGLADQVAAAEQTIQNIDDIVKHPALSAAVGPISAKLPTVFGDTADFESRLEQIKSGAFLQSVKHLQGLGALSNAEGAKAEGAATRMTTATSEEGFKKAAAEYREVVSKGIERAKKKAGGDFSPTPSTNSPTPAAQKSGGRRTVKFGDL